MSGFAKLLAIIEGPDAHLHTMTEVVPQAQNVNEKLHFDMEKHNYSWPKWTQMVRRRWGDAVNAQA